MRKSIIATILIIIGAVVWLIISKTGGKTEAWDDINYFVLGIPVMLIASAIAGYLAPGNACLWGLCTVIAQPLIMFVQVEGRPLMVIGLIFFLIIAVLCALAAGLTGKYGRRNEDAGDG
jgi:hypothetical protein